MRPIKNEPKIGYMSLRIYPDTKKRLTALKESMNLTWDQFLTAAIEKMESEEK